MHKELETSNSTLEKLRNYLHESGISLDIFMLNYLDTLEEEFKRLSTHLDHIDERTKHYLENGLILSKSCANYEKAIDVISSILFNPNGPVNGTFVGNAIEFDIKGEGLPRRINLKESEMKSVKRAFIGDDE